MFFLNLNIRLLFRFFFRACNHKRFFIARWGITFVKNTWSKSCFYFECVVCYLCIYLILFLLIYLFLNRLKIVVQMSDWVLFLWSLFVSRCRVVWDHLVSKWTFKECFKVLMILYFITDHIILFLNELGSDCR